MQDLPEYFVPRLLELARKWRQSPTSEIFAELDSVLARGAKHYGYRYRLMHGSARIWP